MSHEGADPARPRRGSTGTDSIGLADLVLRGPIAAAGLSDDLARAEALRERGDHAEAAAAFKQVAGRLPSLARPMRDVLLRRAAYEFEEAGDDRRAYALLRELAEESLERDPIAGATGALREASRVASPPDRPELDALFGLDKWTDDADAAIEALGALVDGAEHDRRWTWAARLSSLLSVDERWAALAKLAAKLDPRSALAPGPMLEVALDAVHAHHRLGESIDAECSELRAWAAGQASEIQALTEQRLAVIATREDDLGGAITGFEAAVRHWDAAGGRDEQVVEAFEALGTARTLLGQPSFVQTYVELLDRHDVVDSPAGRAHRLEARAMRALGRDRLIESRADLLHALRRHMTGGNLRGELRVRQLLAAVLEGGGRLGDALWFAVSAGDTKHTSRLAAQLSWHDASGCLRPTGARWERAATWVAVQRTGTSAPPIAVADLAPRLIGDARPAPDPGDADGPTSTARRALATVILQIPESGRPDALEVLRDEVLHGQWAARAAADALELVTELEISDESVILLDAVLGENGPAVRGASALLIRLVPERRDLRDRVVRAALAGDAEAEEIAAYAGIDDHALVARYGKRVEGLLTDAGPNRTSEQLSSYEPIGIFARYCAPERQQAIVEHLHAVAVDDARLPPNRASAVRALGNAIDVLTPATAAGLLESLLPEIATRTAASPEDRFARFRISWGPQDMLGVAVVELAGSIAARFESLGALATQAIDDALVTGTSRMYAAAARALARAPHLPDPLPQAAWLGHPEAAAREWGLAVVAGRAADFAAAARVRRLADDPTRRVRLALAVLAGEHPSPAASRSLLELLSGDDDAEVRARARRALGEAALPPTT